MDDLEARTTALFGRRFTLLIADAIMRLDESFTRQSLIEKVALGNDEKTLSVIDRELKKLEEAGLLRRVGPRRVRVASSYWHSAAELLQEWLPSPPPTLRALPNARYKKS
jgi:DNA-binding HxlR family transcriptional regulator